MRLFGHNCRVENIIKGDHMISALPAGDKPFLGRGNDEINSMGNGTGDSFGNYAIVRVINRDGAGFINGG